MNRHIRTHMKMFYDDVWADMLINQYGMKTKAFKDRKTFSWTKYNPQGSKGIHISGLKDGFTDVKPKEFTLCDVYLLDHVRKEHKSYISNFINLADNRMQMGDFRYDNILRQNLDNYNLIIEMYRRLKHASLTENLEYVIDAYNMFRIEVFKRKSFNYLIVEKNKILFFIRYAMYEEWELTSIDDGVHAKEK